MGGGGGRRRVAGLGGRPHPPRSRGGRGRPPPCFRPRLSRDRLRARAGRWFSRVGELSRRGGISGSPRTRHGRERRHKLDVPQVNARVHGVEDFDAVQMRRDRTGRRLGPDAVLGAIGIPPPLAAKAREGGRRRDQSVAVARPPTANDRPMILPIAREGPRQRRPGDLEGLAPRQLTASLTPE